MQSSARPGSRKTNMGKRHGCSDRAGEGSKQRYRPRLYGILGASVSSAAKLPTQFPSRTILRVSAMRFFHATWSSMPAQRKVAVQRFQRLKVSRRAVSAIMLSWGGAALGAIAKTLWSSLSPIITRNPETQNSTRQSIFS